VAVPSGMCSRAAAFFQDTVTNWLAEANPTDVGDQTILLNTIGREFLPQLRRLATDTQGTTCCDNYRVWRC